MSKTCTLLLCLLLGACAATQPVPEDRFYRLDAAQPQQPLKAPLLHGGLVVEPMRADPLRSGRAVVFSERGQPLLLRRYHYEFWVDQPPRLLSRALLAYLRAGGVADRIIDDGTGAYRLSLRLLKFEQIVDRQSAQAEVSVQATLSTGPSDRVVWSHTYSRQQAAASRQLYATAEAMRGAVQMLFEALLADISALPVAAP